MLIWRRSYATPPPALDKDSEHYPGHDPRYAQLDESELPVGECLADTVDRVLDLLSGPEPAELLAGPQFRERPGPVERAGREALLARHRGALAEDMEAFAVALACARAGLGLSVLRGISNEVGDRDPRGWAIGPALAAVRDRLIEAAALDWPARTGSASSPPLASESAPPPSDRSRS